MSTFPFELAIATDLEAIRRQLRAGLRTVTKTDDDGMAHEMVWIPQFTVPAGVIGTGDDAWPSGDNIVTMGGFFIDRYQCHDPSTLIATSPKAVSQPGYAPASSLSQAAAAILANARTFYGVECRLPRLAEWAAVTLAAWLLEPGALRGNTAGAGRDHRDTDTASRKGLASGTFHLTGTGPNAFGIAGGPHDILGNVAEWLDDSAPCGRLTIRKTAAIADAGGISAADPSVTLDGIQDLDRWPAADGVILIDDEYIRYATFTDNLDGTAVLGGLTRGHMGSTADIHADNAAVALLKDFCIVPGAMSMFVTGLDNVTNPVTFTVHDLKGTPTKSAIQAGDIICVHTERLTVTAVAGDAVTATRGSESTVPASHLDWSVALVRPSAGANIASTGLYGFIRTFRTDDPDLEALMVPALMQTTVIDDGTDEPGDRLDMVGLGGQTHAILRGGCPGGEVSPLPNTGHHRHGMSFVLTADTAAILLYGFRCVWSPV